MTSINESLNSGGQHHEQEVKEPKILVQIALAPHRTASDLTAVKGYFAQADIYIMEAVLWTPDHYKFVNNLSQGKNEPIDVNKLGLLSFESAGFIMAELEMIHGSGKPIGFIDVPSTYSTMDSWLDRESKRANKLSYMMKPDWGETLRLIREHVATFSKSLDDREAYMVDSFPETIEQILREHPTLRQKKELSVLIHLGSAHISVAEVFRKNGYEVKTNALHQFPFSHPYKEAYQKKRNGEIVSDDLLAKVLLSFLFSKIFEENIYNISTDSHKLSAFIGKVVASFSYDEVKDIYRNTPQATSVRRLNEMFINMLRAKGMSIPKTEEELDVLIYTSTNASYQSY